VIRHFSFLGSGRSRRLTPLGPFVLPTPLAPTAAALGRAFTWDTQLILVSLEESTLILILSDPEIPVRRLTEEKPCHVHRPRQLQPALPPAEPAARTEVSPAPAPDTRHRSRLRRRAPLEARGFDAAPDASPTTGGPTESPLTASSSALAGEETGGQSLTSSSPTTTPQGAEGLAQSDGPALMSPLDPPPDDDQV
jgi:hypothetical protein